MYVVTAMKSELNNAVQVAQERVKIQFADAFRAIYQRNRVPDSFGVDTPQIDRLVITGRSDLAGVYYKDGFYIILDCHVSDKGDNNAIMAQLLLQGTNFVNFVGFNAWLGEERHVEAVQVTEWEEPQAVIGSYLHRHAYPDWYAEHEKRGRTLPEAHDHASGASLRRPPAHPIAGPQVLGPVHGRSG